ncbi:MAG: hypothetical protein HY352_02780 [Candidatus Omnitrophica bacterium]|nr:hypothetical protein [Candidatus Omnitrophota bacterium]
MTVPKRSLIFAALVCLACPPGVVAEVSSAPRTVREWLEQEHRFFHRYLAIVRQATHDYSYGYKTPPLLMPAAMDVFTGYVAYIHDEETRFLYPVLLRYLTPEQQDALRLIQIDQDKEAGTVRLWQQDLTQYEAGHKKLPQVADTIDYLVRMLNRHIVLQEQHVFPVLDMLTPAEQTTVLKHMRAFEKEAFGANGRAQYEQLLSAIEGQIKALGGRIW